jgi:hypothetical protein
LGAACPAPWPSNLAVSSAVSYRHQPAIKSTAAAAAAAAENSAGPMCLRSVRARSAVRSPPRGRPAGSCAPLLARIQLTGHPQRSHVSTPVRTASAQIGHTIPGEAPSFAPAAGCSISEAFGADVVAVVLVGTGYRIIGVRAPHRLPSGIAPGIAEGGEGDFDPPRGTTRGVQHENVGGAL